MTSRDTQSHLTDEQFSDLLAGDSVPKAAFAHLEACGHCRTELSDLRTAMGSFNQLSLAWAEAEAPRRVPVPSRWALGRRLVPAWGFTAACALAVAAIGVNRQTMLHQAEPVVAVSTTSASPSSTELAEDNRLMLSIDQELNYQPRPSVPVAELRGKYPARQVSN